MTTLSAIRRVLDRDHSLHAECPCHEHRAARAGDLPKLLAWLHEIHTTYAHSPKCQLCVLVSESGGQEALGL